MDLLFLIKVEHDQMRGIISRLASNPPQDRLLEMVDELNRTLEKQIKVETEFLFPEIEDLFPGVDILITRALVRHDQMRTALAAVHKQALAKKQTGTRLAEAVQDLVSAIDDHIEDQQQFLIPKLRKLVPTRDREELGQIFQEVLSEAKHGM